MKKGIMILVVMIPVICFGQNRRSELVKDTTPASGGIVKSTLVYNSLSAHAGSTKANVVMDQPEYYLTADGKRIMTADNKKTIKQ